MKLLDVIWTLGMFSGYYYNGKLYFSLSRSLIDN